MLAKILRLPAVMLLFALTGSSVLHARAPYPLGIPSMRVGMSAGLVLLSTALTIGASAMMQMRKHRTTVEPGQRPSSLVTSGIFGRTRNPIYLSMLVLVVAVAVMTNGLWFVVAAIVLWLLLDRLVIRAEEKTIGEVFGDDYASYKQRVRRWL